MTGRGVVYEPKILRSLAEICEAFGVGEKQVRRWVQDDAPIVVDGRGKRRRYSAEAARLQLWRETEANRKKAVGSLAF